MALDPIKLISDSKVSQTISNGFNKVCTSIGNAFEKSPKKDSFTKVLNVIEPTGANNSFPTFLTLMGVAVVFPRVKAALQRNPNDKEATMDEIKEILFRDIQTIAIILLATNAIASIVSGKATRFIGLPLTDKPFSKVFNTDTKGIKGLAEKVGEFAKNPVLKTKKIFGNLGKALNPMGGVNALNNEAIVSKYSGFNSVDEIQKLLNQVEAEKGDKSKVFDIIVDSLIKKQQNVIENAQNIQKAGGTIDTKGIEKVLIELNELKAKGVDGLMNLQGDDLKLFGSSKVGKQMVEFFQDKDNALVTKGREVNGVLKTCAWIFDIMYLGFGLPALNQKRLEKKYLEGDNKKPDGVKTVKTQENQDVNTLNGHRLNSSEVRIFSQFVK